MFQQSTAFIKNKTSAIMVKLAGLQSGLSHWKLIHSVQGLVLPVFKRQKTAILAIIPFSLVAIFLLSFLLNNQINSLQQELISQGILIKGQFPESEASNWLARARSARGDWQIESLFKLKAIIMAAAKNRHSTYDLIRDDKDNIIRAHTTERLVGSVYKPVSGEEIFRDENGLTALKFVDTTSNESLVDFDSAIYYGKGDNKIRIGSYHFGLSYEDVDGAVARKKILFPLLSSILLLLAFGFIIVRDRVYMKRKSQIETDKNRLGPYILEEKIATGGMGELFLARKEIGKFRMRVAVKRILSDRADDKDYIASLLDEANVASQLKHPNIATLHDFGNIEGTYFIAMEYIDGADLLSIIKKYGGDISINHAIYIMSEVCTGLDYAHNKADDFSKELINIVHRDISPQNILVSLDGDIKIVDFGIARAAQRQSKKTTVGIVKGKLHYMSPEQASASGEIDRRSDIFSLGLVCYELLAGERVYQGDTTQELLRMACQADITPLKQIRADVPDELNRILMKALASRASQRYQTAKELYDDLRQFIHDNPEFECTRVEMSKFMLEHVKDKNSAASEGHD